ncbi:Uma2 family endonuclease [Streptomyces sp. NA04227]|uniref:Uma2 family endonuclease n=1 Tax=Streptomyces sp. NA04227 TaxID=2742136 RepID=UPI00159034F4|nr:Uma2 family endonuclease [Streptomyces sp. NA04227]QKW07215.1 Uma2 family endonuclease [Streptomyces sp. NA04227]
MTVVANDRIEMADSGEELTLDRMFEVLETMPVPEGTKAEIVGGNIFMSPQRDTHWEIIADVYEQLRAKYPRNRLKSDVRVDYPGFLNGFASDITVLAEGATKTAQGRWRHQDVVCVVEVISKGTAHNDYDPKKTAYALAGIPVYLIADPYQGRCHVHTSPKGDDYATETRATFGQDLDLRDTEIGLVLHTGDFPRD